MGRWMQVLRSPESQPSSGQDGSSRHELIEETAPHPVMHAFGSLCQASPGKREVVRAEFPMLERLLRLCRREEYVPSLDGRATYDAWRGGDEPEHLDERLEEILAVLRRAIASGHTVRLML
jgi:hypothetical protein